MISTSDLIVVGLAFLIGFISDANSPQPYHYKNQIVIVDKKYQCPTYCKAKHSHHVYFYGDSFQMIIDKNQLGKKVKKKKSRKK